MTGIINPLFSRKPASQRTEVVSGMSANSMAPSSPISGLPMVQANCHGVPVYVDLDNRVVIPVRLNPEG